MPNSKMRIQMVPRHHIVLNVFAKIALLGKLEIGNPRDTGVLTERCPSEA